MQRGIDLDEKIAVATEGFRPEYIKQLNKISKNNALIITEYMAAMKSETNPSPNYRKTIIKILCMCSSYSNNKSFKSMARKDVLSYLDHLRPKHEEEDSLHKWIGTYNLYLTVLTKFFKWLYNPNKHPKTRPKPSVVQNLFSLKRKEVSIYKPSDIWTLEDDALFLKYCPSKRMKAYHTVAIDTSCRPHEILKLKIKDISWKLSPDKKQYAEVMVNGKTGTINKPLFNSIPYVKDYLDHEHPQSSNKNAPFICGLGKRLGRHIEDIGTPYADIQKAYFPKLLENPDVPQEDKDKIKELLKKPWNPYIFRHSGLTEKSLKIPRLMCQYAGWVEGSTMPQKYFYYFNNQSTNSLLQAEGILSKDTKKSDLLKPKYCPNCNEGNKPDAKFCAKCRMVLTYDAYNETLENQKEKEDKLTAIEERFNSMQSQMQCLITALGNMDQSTKNTSAKQLFENGVYKNEAPSKKEN
jgi:integrase